MATWARVVARGGRVSAAGQETRRARGGCGRALARTLAAIEAGQGVAADIDVLEDHCRWLVMGHTFCALAAGAMFSLASGRPST